MSGHTLCPISVSPWLGYPLDCTKMETRKDKLQKALEIAIRVGNTYMEANIRQAIQELEDQEQNGSYS